MVDGNVNVDNGVSMVDEGVQDIKFSYVYISMEFSTDNEGIDIGVSTIDDSIGIELTGINVAFPTFEDIMNGCRYV